MKVVNLSAEKGTEGKRALINRTLSNLAPSATREVKKSQEAVIQTFKQILDNRFQLLQGLQISGLEEPAPLLLLGPAGIWLMETNPSSGIFRAAQEQWGEMDPKGRAFRPARINVITRILAATGAVQAKFDQMSEDLPGVEPVILFTHPGAHLELQQPAVRLIQADAIARFAAGLLQIRPLIEPESVQRLVERLSQPERAPIQEIELLDEAPKAAPSAAPSVRLPTIPENEPELIRRISRKASFSRYQWSVLALLFFLNLLVLIAALIIVLIIT
jgi:hypothetical protein